MRRVRETQRHISTVSMAFCEVKELNKLYVNGDVLSRGSVCFIMPQKLSDHKNYCKTRNTASLSLQQFPCLVNPMDLMDLEMRQGKQNYQWLERCTAGIDRASFWKFQVKYHEDFEKSKGSFTPVVTDPITERVKKNMYDFSDINYRGIQRRVVEMERKRVDQDQEMNNFTGNPSLCCVPVFVLSLCCVPLFSK